MDIQYYGANCLRIGTKEAAIVIDDTLASLGKKSIIKKGDIVLFTSRDTDVSVAKEAKITITTPGEYEISGVSIMGVGLRSHIDEDGKNTTVFKLVIQDMRILVLGHIYPELSEDVLESIGTVDILLIPVGGNGYTIDPIGANKLIKHIDPKIIIPTHYDISGINYEVPQQSLEEALKVLAMEPVETVEKFKLKSSAAIPESKQLIVIEPQVK